MNTLCRRMLVAVLLAALPAPLAAQGLPTSQPQYLRIIREDVKTGRAAEHAKLEAAWPAAFERANSPDFYLAMESTTSSEAWFVLPSASYAEMGQAIAREQSPALAAELDVLRRKDSEFIDGWRMVELRARPELSRGTYPDLGKQRFWEISIFRMRPGADQVFSTIAKAYGDAADKVGRAVGFRVYQVTAGMPEPTFFIFTSVSSFAEFDTVVSQGEATFKAMMPTLGAEALKAFEDKLIFSETFRMQLSPTMSYVPKAVRDSDPGFWMPKKPAQTKPGT